jgi:hypothetical protein
MSLKHEDSDMSRQISLEPVQSKSNEAFVSAIAHETKMPIDVVRALYEEEVATLAHGATVRQFVGVIATRRVKQQLRANRTPAREPGTLEQPSGSRSH